MLKVLLAKKREVIILLCLMLLSACATPPFDTEGRELASWRPVEALHEPQAQNALVMWGGQIVETMNHSDYSEITIVNLQLDRGGRPQTDGDVGIRFVARVKGFLEPVLYAPGRYITVLGRINGSTHVDAGEALLQAPVISAEDNYLWPKDERDWRSNVHFGLGVGIRL